MADKNDAEKTAKIIWESWITDCTNEEECVYEEGEGKEDQSQIIQKHIGPVNIWISLYGIASVG